MKHIAPEFYDDCYLAELINSAYVKPARPWWHLGLTVFCLGATILIGMAWYYYE